MCIKSSKASSLLSPTTILNPSAQEWRPTPHTQASPLQPHIIYTPHPQPAAAPLPQQTAVQVAAFSAAPPQKLGRELPPLPYYPALSFSSCQGYIPYGPCTRSQPVYHSTLVSFQPNGYFFQAAKPIFGGEVKFVGGGVKMNPEKKKLECRTEKVERQIMRSPKSHPVVVRRKCFSPGLRRTMSSFSFEKKPMCRQEWKPRKAYSDKGVSGGAAVPSQLCASPSNPLAAVPPSGEFSPSSKTTVMIKNIPNQLRRDFMLEFLDRYCNAYSLEYDFLYLPMDFRKEDNLGYAFVNFTSPGAALKLKESLQNYRWDTVKTERGSYASKKICEITWARIQGKEGLVKRFQNSNFACDKLDFLPVVLDPPRNGSDSKPAPPVILGRLHQRGPSKIY